MKAILFHFVLLAVAFFGCLQLSQAVSKAEGEAMVAKFSDECTKEVGITADEVKFILNSNLADIKSKPYSDKMKCFMSCFYKKIGIIDATGKPNNEMAIRFFEHRFEEHKDKVKPALVKCSVAKGANECDSVYKFDICMLETIKG